jgi:hypothetical protein
MVEPEAQTSTTTTSATKAIITNKIPLAYVRPTRSLDLLSHREIDGVLNA